MSKKCGGCGEFKPLDDFLISIRYRDGRHSYCRLCRNAANRKWKRENKEKVNASCKRWREANPLVSRAMTKRWRERNKERAAKLVSDWGKRNREKRLAYVKKYATNNMPKVLARNKAYSCRKRGSVPPWSNGFFIEEAYELAKLRTEKTGIKWVVDHIVPLKHKLVCGLHSHTNVRVITDFENCSKGNRWWPNMPEVVNGD